MGPAGGGQGRGSPKVEAKERKKKIIAGPAYEDNTSPVSVLCEKWLRTLSRKRLKKGLRLIDVLLKEGRKKNFD